jgi:hypothetical protein
MFIKIQQDATVCRYLFTAKSLYMFRVSQHPSSGVLKTVTAASGAGHTVKLRINWNELTVCVGLLTSDSNG